MELVRETGGYHYVFGGGAPFPFYPQISHSMPPNHYSSTVNISKIKSASTQTDKKQSNATKQVISVNNFNIRPSSATSAGSLGRKSLISSYDPINDPHLRDYFERKFSLSSAKRLKKPRKLGPNEVIYKIRVKTGNLTFASTDANVYLTIVGKKGTIKRQHLFNKVGSIRTEHGVKYKFDRGSINLFRIIGQDVGNLTYIVVEHDGQDLTSSWFLDEIAITHTKLHKTWVFECHDWLSLHMGLYRTQIQLFPTRMKQKYTETDYEVVVVTGDRTYAGTDANVFITLLGTKNRASSKMALISKGKKDFERGQTDIFTVHSDYVGPLTKIRIEHDNSGKAPGWFLERIVITDLKDPGIKYFFPCGKWLAKDEGDGLICRELIAHVDPLGIRKSKKYKITVFTGNKANAGTDADVTIVLFGTLGDSGEWKLDDKRNNFERGSINEFIIEAPSIGDLEKIRIGHNNKGVAAGWFLYKVIVDDLEAHKVYDFLCNRWLAVDEEDGQTYVTLVAGSGSGDAKPGVPYKIHVKTGDVRNGGTSAKVYIELFGGKRGEESSGKIYLTNGSFKTGRTDIFNVDVDRMISPLSHVIIGHDNSGAGPGWFLDRVDVECPSIGMKQVFPCDRWLARDEDDGLIERILHENTSLREQRKPKTTWFLWVYTSDTANAGTDANVTMVFYGDKGKTDEIELKAKSNMFEKGACDKFKIETDVIGQPFKIRVQHDNKGNAPGWHLDRIEAENMDTKERYLFRCNRWLARDEDDHEIIRELPAEGDSIKKPLPVEKYEVEVITGDKRNAGTDANVFINLFGDFGDTGDRPLRKSKNKNKFERNSHDVFIIEAVKLKKIRKIIIGHDGSGPGAGWFLDKIIVKQIGDSRYDQAFECKRWLAVDEDDGAIVRELVADQSQYLDKISYHVSVKTGDISNAGTDANVHLKIFGTQGDTGLIKLKHSDNTMNKFEKGRVDLFKIEQEDIGKIEKIRIGHDGKGIGSGWFLDYVQIDVPSKGTRYMFATHRWLDEKEDDGLTEIELVPTEVKKVRKLIPYVIIVKTGDKKGAGTDADVFVQLYGADGGKSEEIYLDNKSDNFERGKEEAFKIEAEDVGPLFKIRVGHNNKGLNSGWFLEKIIIQRHALKGSQRLKTGSRSSSLNRSDTPDIEEYFFYSNQWFARDEGDKQIVREILATDKNGKPLFDLDEVPYVVKVYTGDVFGAGTDANVFLTMYGTNNDSGERQLKDSDNRNKFERKQVDTFEVKAIDLGELQKVRIRHDNKGGGAAWYLEKIEIINPKNNKGYLFNCQKWLATDKEDGKISRELPALDLAQSKHVTFRAGVKNLKEQVLLETEAITTTYNVYVTTSDKRGAGTDANVYVQLFGEHNDTGKLKLETSKSHKNKFERGQTDLFDIKESDIGDIRKIKIGHDGSGVGSGWHLEKVVIDAPKLGRRWTFPCGRWLDKGEDDGKIERELEPLEMDTEDYVPYVNYEIVVYTSDLRGADTTANPYIVLYGKEMHTSQMNICKSKTEKKDKFKRGAIDRFVLELEDVGDKIEKIRIGHDNAGMTPGWHVDKVEIRRLKKSGKGSYTYVFPCNRWLARDEDDRAIERDIVAKKVVDEKYKDGELKAKEKDIEDTLEMKKYVVDVYTGDQLRAGTNANVFIQMFGDKGDSGEKKLIKSETHVDKFERNQMDRFVLETADLGRLYKVKIRHDNSGISADWFLDRIEVHDEKRDYIFICERWLSKSKEDKQLERTLYEKNYTGPRSESNSSLTLKSNIGGSQISSRTDSFRSSSLKRTSPSPLGNIDEVPEGPVIPYTIVLKTGHDNDAGTSAQVYIRLIGPKKKIHTGRIKLQLAKKKKFEPGSSETFSIEALDVGEIRQVEVGHDGVTPGMGWLLDEIEIHTPIKGLSYYIKCDSWLAKDKSDGQISRVFNIDDASTQISTYKSLIPYNLTIFTGDVSKAGTDCNVTIKVFGTKGSSRDIVIEKMENRFERAAIDSMTVELEDIGALKKVRVSHDGKGSRKDWYLDRVELTNMNTQKQYVFDCGEWLSKSKDGSKGLSIDIPLNKGGKSTIKKTSYKITVKTSDINGAGTDANVSLTLFGENGDSGQLDLKKSETNFNKFERNQVDIFTYKDLLSLGELTKCRIWHDNSGTIIGNASWHLDNVLVEDLSTGKVYNFPCNKWLSLSKDDKQIVRELTCANNDNIGTPHVGERTAYEIIVVTSDKRDAGTTQNGWIALIGEKNRSSKQFLLENSSRNKILRRGQTDQFVFETKSVGKLKRIVVGLVEREDVQIKIKDRADAGWHVHEILVKDLSTDTTYAFPVNSWIYLNEDGLEFELGEKSETLITKTRALENIKYEVSVVTGNEKGAGTDSNVTIILYGENGDSGPRPLKQSFKNLFEKGQTDKFVVECLDLGELQKLHVEHDNSSFFKPGWFLDKIEVTNTANGKTVVFPCHKWLDKKRDDGEIARDLYPVETGRESRQSLRSRSESKQSIRSKEEDRGSLSARSRENTKSPKDRFRPLDSKPY